MAGIGPDLVHSRGRAFRKGVTDETTRSNATRSQSRNVIGYSHITAANFTSP